MADSKLIVTIAGQFESLDKATKGAVESVKRMGANLTSIGSSFALGISAPIAAFGAAAISSAADLGALKDGLKVTAGSAAAAAVQFEQLKQVAKLPGLGLKEAIEGSINLQAIGISADRSKSLLLKFGNALASVGRGRVDLQEVIVQLRQLGSRAHVTSEDLKPLVGRVPQLAGIIKEKFGPEALGNPAETFKKLGISATQFIAIIETELGKLPRFTGGMKNDIENLRDSMTIAFATAGEALAPFAKMFIDEFAIPALEKLKGLADGFKELPKPIQGVAVSLGGIAVAGPLAIAATGSLLSNFALMTEAVTKLGGGVVLLGKALSAIPWLLVAAEVINTLSALNAADNASRALAASEKDLEKSIDKTIAALRKQGVAVDEANRFKLTPARTMMFAGEAVEVMPGQRGTETTKEFIKQLNQLALAHGRTVKPAMDNAGAHNNFGTAAAVASVASRKAEQDFSALTKALQEQAVATALLNGTLKPEPAQILSRQVAILKGKFDEAIDTIAKFRIQGFDAFDFPKLEEARTRIQDLTFDIKNLGLALRTDASGGVDIELPPEPSGVSQKSLMVANVDADFYGDIGKEVEATNRRVAHSMREVAREIKMGTDTLADGFVRFISEGGRLRDHMVQAMQDIGKSLLRTALSNHFKNMAKEIQSLVQTHLPALSRALADVLGQTESVAQVSSTAAQGAAAGANAATTGAQAGAQAAANIGKGFQAGPIGGIITAVSTAVTAVSSVVANFQFKEMNKSLHLVVDYMKIVADKVSGGASLSGAAGAPTNISLDNIAKYTIHIAAQLTDRMQPLFDTYLPYLRKINDRMESGVGTGGGQSYTFNFSHVTFGTGVSMQLIETLFTEAARRKQLTGK